MFKAIAKMFDGNRTWEVTIYDQYETMMDAERAARRFAHKYEDMCLYVQVLKA